MMPDSLEHDGTWAVSRVCDGSETMAFFKKVAWEQCAKAT
jgi:hypothetical protein